MERELTAARKALNERIDHEPHLDKMFESWIDMSEDMADSADAAVAILSKFAHQRFFSGHGLESGSNSNDFCVAPNR